MPLYQFFVFFVCFYFLLESSGSQNLVSNNQFHLIWFSKPLVKSLCPNFDFIRSIRFYLTYVPEIIIKPAVFILRSISHESLNSFC